MKDRVTSLVEAFRGEDIRNRVLSGTEEQYGKIKEHLTNISTLMKDAEEAAATRKQAKAQKTEEKDRLSKDIRAAGEDGRGPPGDDDSAAISEIEAAKQEFLSNGGFEAEWPAELKSQQDDLILPPLSETTKATRKSRNVRNNSDAVSGSDDKWIAALKEQNKQKYEFKRDMFEAKLELRNKELEIERLKLEVESKNWDVLAKRLEGNVQPDK